MAAHFTNFIIRLAEDPALLADFQKDPDGAAQRAQLSPAEIAVFKSRNTKLVREAIVHDMTPGSEAAGVTVVVLTWTRMPSSVTLDFQGRPTFETRLKTQLGEIARGGGGGIR